MPQTRLTRCAADTVAQGRRPIVQYSALLLALTASMSPAAARAAQCAAEHWVTAWQSPPTDAVQESDSAGNILRAGGAQTFRSIISPLGAGQRMRLHLSNRYGTAPVTFSSVSIAHQTQQAAIDVSTAVPVLFSGKTSVTLAAGQDRVSDPLTYTVRPLGHLTISLATPDAPKIPTHHTQARQYSYATAPNGGDHSSDAGGDAYVQAVILRPFVTGLDVEAPAATSALVTLGDSITDGVQCNADYSENVDTVDLDQRYPDYLFRRLQAAGRNVVVANSGIGGNKLLRRTWINVPSDSALKRLDADVLAQAGVTDVILMMGINDIALKAVSGDIIERRIKQAYVELIDRMHAKGLRVLHGTLLPSGAGLPIAYGSPQTERIRQSINTWIRTSSPADAIVDFDAALRDPNDPSLLAAQYDGGDGLHPSAAGYEAMAAAIDLAQIQGNGCP